MVPSERVLDFVNFNTFSTLEIMDVYFYRMATRWQAVALFLWPYFALIQFTK